MQKLFDQEAGKYGVYPLDDRFVERAFNPERPSSVRGRKQFTYSASTTRLPEGSAPPMYQRSHSITADVIIPKNGANGVIVAEGGVKWWFLVVFGKWHTCVRIQLLCPILLSDCCHQSISTG